MTASPAGEHLFWPEDRWRNLQADRLRSHLQHAATSPLYRALHLAPDAPLAQLPLTTKDQLSAAGKNAWAVAPEQVREWVCTSGTTGRPLDVPLTARDLDRLAENEAVALHAAGLRPGDLCILAVAMDRMFVAGLAYHLGAQKIGAAAVRAGALVAAQPAMLRDILARLAPAGPAPRAFLIAVPSFLAAVEPPEIPLAAVIAIGEPTRTDTGAPNALAQLLAQRLACPILSTYALTETCTTFAESPACTGGHLNPALGMVEILDPDTLQPLPDNQPGEVVITPLRVEGLPLLRFRTGDIAWLRTDPCPCGRTTPRLGPILGRRQQLLKIRGASVYPAAILEAVRTTPGIADCCIIAEAEHTLSDRVTVAVTLLPDAPASSCADLTARLRALLRVAPELRIIPPADLAALQLSAGRKLQRFLDRRTP